MPEEKQIQLQSFPEVRPFFATSTLAGVTFTEYKTKKREAIIQITSICQNVIVSNVSITIEHAKALIGALQDAIETSEKFEKTGETPKKPIIKTTEEHRYIG